MADDNDIRELEDGTVLHSPKNTLVRIDHLWAFLSVDPKDGTEGLVAAPLPGLAAPVPLIAADEKRLKGITPIAESIARVSGMKIKLVKFTAREEVREINSGH